MMSFNNSVKASYKLDPIGLGICPVCDTARSDGIQIIRYLCLYSKQRYLNAVGF